MTDRDEYWVVWNDYNYSTPETYHDEGRATARFEEMCRDGWVSSARMTHCKVVRRYPDDGGVSANVPAVPPRPPAVIKADPDLLVDTRYTG